MNGMARLIDSGGCRWLETKLFELGMIGDPSRTYKVRLLSRSEATQLMLPISTTILLSQLLCVADRTSMFSVFGKKGGKTYKHEVGFPGNVGSISLLTCPLYQVKPLAYFWKQPDFKQW